MAGFWHLSHHQMRDPNGNIFAGAKAYFFEADSLLPITVYQDYGLGTAHPNPVQANAYGIFPPVFFDEADEFYRQRITTSAGVIIPGTDVGTIPIIGPSGGGGGSEVPVDSNSLLQTGDPLWVPNSGSRSGFVRMNGRTIGSATSGASERANSDCENLFLWYWNNFSDTYAAVSGGRGASAAADWSANKTVTLFDMRGKGPFGMAGMGNTDSGVFDDLTFDLGDTDTAASVAGDAMATLAKANIPNYNLVVTGLQTSAEVMKSSGLSYVTTNVANGGDSNALTTNTTVTENKSKVGIEGTLPSGGSGTAFDKMPPFRLGTWYQRL